MIGNTTLSTIDNIVVTPGNDTPDNDADAENLPVRCRVVIMDTNDNDVDDGQAIDMGIEGVLVELVDTIGLDRSRPRPIAWATGSFARVWPLAPRVIFHRSERRARRQSLVNDNVGPDDSIIDSDADRYAHAVDDRQHVVVAGQDTPE